MRADQAQTNTNVMKASAEPKPTVVQPLVGLFSLALLAIVSWQLAFEVDRWELFWEIIL